MSMQDSTGPKVDKTPKDTLDELRTLTTTYARQETVDPLKNLGQWVGFGLGGAVAVALGLALLGLGALRGLQAISWFEDSFSWAPYLLMFLVFVGAIGLTLTAMMKKPEFGDRR